MSRKETMNTLEVSGVGFHLEKGYSKTILAGVIDAVEAENSETGQEENTRIKEVFLRTSGKKHNGTADWGRRRIVIYEKPIRNSIHRLGRERRLSGMQKKVELYALGHLTATHEARELMTRNPEKGSRERDSREYSRSKTREAVKRFLG